MGQLLHLAKLHLTSHAGYYKTFWAVNVLRHFILLPAEAGSEPLNLGSYLYCSGFCTTSACRAYLASHAECYETF